MKKPKPLEQSVNADLRGSWPALQRAAQRAREIAIQTRTDLIISRGGIIEHLSPSALATERFIAQVAGTLGDDFPDDINDTDLGPDAYRDALQ